MGGGNYLFFLRETPPPPCLPAHPQKRPKLRPPPLKLGFACLRTPPPEPKLRPPPLFLPACARLRRPKNKTPPLFAHVAHTLTLPRRTRKYSILLGVSLLLRGNGIYRYISWCKISHFIIFLVYFKLRHRFFSPAASNGCCFFKLFCIKNK